MHHFFIKNRIHEYMDNNLQDPEKSEFEKSIVEYPDLIDELEGFRQQRELLLTQGKIEAPEDLLGSILASVDEEKIPASYNIKQGSNNNLWKTIAFIAAAVVVWVLIPTQSTPIPRNDIHSAQTLPIPNNIQLPNIKEKESQMEVAVPIKEPVPIVDTPTIAPKPPTPVAKAEIPKSTPTTKKYVVTSPGDMYFPEDTATEVIEVAPQSHQTYQFQVARKDILFRLQELADTHHGSILTARGERLELTNLTNEKFFYYLEMLVPASDANQVDGELRQLGGEFFGQSVENRNGQAVFPLEIFY